MDTAEATFTFAIYVLVVVRLTRVINFDVVFDPIRSALVRVFKGSPMAVYVITCTWCMSMWVALALCPFPAIVLGLNWLWAIAFALAASTIAGLLAPHTADKTLSAEDDK